MDSDLAQKEASFWQTSLRHLDRTVAKVARYKGWLSAFELLIIALVAVYIGRAYLNLNPDTWPFGREFGMVIQSHTFWERVRECGWCAIWNSTGDGGYPALVEIFGAPLHPTVAITTLLLGVFNGTKIAILISLWVAGVAQWWLARELRVGWLPRMWSALTAVSGGHLAGRMEGGLFTILMSTAFASLVIPALLAVNRRRDRRSIVMLGLVLASAILGGQGYLQVGIIVTLPAVYLLIRNHGSDQRLTWKRIGLAGLLAVLLAAPLIVPVMRFSPNFGKYADPEFTSAQPLEYLPLNLVINDPGFYTFHTVLGKLPATAPYTLYIGWVAVILAVIAVGLARKEAKPKVYFLAAGVILVFMTASGIVLKWVMEFISLVEAVRFPSFIAGFAVPMILGLAAYGLDLLLSMNWPNLMMRLSNAAQPQSWSLSLKWVLLIPLFLNLKSTTSFANAWMTTVQKGGDVPWVIDQLKTPHRQWVSPPFGEHYFITPSITSDLKVTPSLKPWGWKGREIPKPRIVALRGPLEDPNAEFVAESFGIFVYRYEAEQYAYVESDHGSTPCAADGLGGQINVTCTNQPAGRLIIKENMYGGWRAWQDGEPATLVGDAWLELDVPEGNHTYLFKFNPWDVPLGLVLSTIGIILCVWLWISSEPSKVRL